MDSSSVVRDGQRIHFKQSPNSITHVPIISLFQKINKGMLQYSENIVMVLLYKTMISQITELMVRSFHFQ